MSILCETTPEHPHPGFGERKMDITVSPPTEHDVRSQFLQLAADLQSPPEASSKWANQIQLRYTEPQRHYHTLTHISSMLNLLPKYEDRINNLPAFKLAIFFHDIIYDPKAKDNELQSIECFRSFAMDIELAPKLVTIVVNFIERTITHTLSTDTTNLDAGTDADLRLFLDFDLEILSRDEIKYAEYATQIRNEYGHFSEKDYCAGRIGVLKSFLNRDRLYFSNQFYEHCEAQARGNIEREIEYLRRQFPTEEGS